MCTCSRKNDKPRVMGRNRRIFYSGLNRRPYPLCAFRGFENKPIVRPTVECVQQTSDQRLLSLCVWCVRAHRTLCREPHIHPLALHGVWRPETGVEISEERPATAAGLMQYLASQLTRILVYEYFIDGTLANRLSAKFILRAVTKNRCRSGPGSCS